jgi:hypothetical protein
MPNSQVTANLTLQVQDTIPPGNQNIVNQIMPPLVFQSPGTGGLGIISAMYQVVLPGATISLIPGGIPTMIFVFVRNLGPAKVGLSVGYSAAGGAQNNSVLGPGGMFLFGSSGPNSAGDNGVTAVLIASVGNTNSVVQYLLAS